MRSPEISEIIRILVFVLCLLSTCTSLTTSNDFATVDKNKNGGHYRSGVHPIRHQRHHDTLNRSRHNHHHHRHSSNFVSSGSANTRSTTKSPTEGVRNLLSSRERDTRRIPWHVSTYAPPRIVTSPKPDYYRPHNSVTTNFEKLPPKVKQHSTTYENVREKTFDEIIQEIARITKRKRTTTTTTTETPITQGLDDQYYDEDALQGDEAGEDSNDDTGPQQLYRNKKQDVSDMQTDSSAQTAESYNPGDLTSLKFQQLGTHDAVRQSMRQHNEAQRRRDKSWQQHVRRSMEESKCKVPKPQVFPSSDDPSKIYVPRCTVLFRCSDDTACCPTADKTCVAENYEYVELDFRVSVPSNRSSISVTHYFLNHTSCHCVDKAEHHRSRAPEPIIQPDDSCHCPASTYRKVFVGSQCKCNFTCIQECYFKREGRESFNMEERGCISRGLCERPHCNHGHYRVHEGRCPSRNEKIAAIHAVRSTPQPSQHSNQQLL